MLTSPEPADKPSHQKTFPWAYSRTRDGDSLSRRTQLIWHYLQRHRKLGFVRITDRELAARFKVCRRTVQYCLHELASKLYIDRKDRQKLGIIRLTSSFDKPKKPPPSPKPSDTPIVIELIAKAKAEGFTLFTNKGELCRHQYDGRKDARLSDELVARITAYKPQIMAYLDGARHQRE